MEKKESGQTIIEIVFLIGITFLLLSGLTTSAIFSIKASRYSRNKSIATRVIRDQIEAIKAGKQSADFWSEEDLDIGAEWACADVVVPENFGCEYVYYDWQEVGGKAQVELRIISWWDSAGPPDDWWDFGSGDDTRKNNVILTTVISNWEQ